MKNKFSILYSIGFAFLSCLSVHALPGDSIQTATTKFYSNSFFEVLQIADCTNYIGTPSGPVFGEGIFHYLFGIRENSYCTSDHLSPGRFKDYQFYYSIDFNQDSEKIYQERISFVLNVNNGILTRKYKQKSYDLRKDTEILEIINGVWGQEIVADFINSKFTDMFGQSPMYRHVYEGKRFAYEISSMGCPSSNCISDSLAIAIIIPEYIEAIRIQSEYEERL